MADSKDKPTTVESQSTSDKSGRLIFSILLSLWAFYVYLLVRGPVAETTEQYNISPLTLLLLRLTIALPYLLTWLLTTHAFLRLYRYSRTLQDSPEAQPFRYFTYGIGVMLPSMMIPSFLGAIRGLVETHSQSYVILTILTNYAYVLPILIAFGFILRGANDLTNRMPATSALRIYLAFAVLLTSFAYVWLDLIFTNTLRSHAVGHQPATYYLPDSLIVLTIIMPWMAAWIMGVLNIAALKKYREHVKGILYRRSITSLVWGMIGVILNTILLQGLLSLGTARMTSIGLGGILGIVYAYLFLQAAGFYYIARGTKQLTQMEIV